MHLCKTCNYLTSIYANLKIHYKSKKHFEQVIKYNKITIEGPFYCEYCNKEYTYKSSLYRHRKICSNSNVINNTNSIPSTNIPNDINDTPNIKIKKK